MLKTFECDSTFFSDVYYSPLSPGIVGAMVTLKYNFAHMTFWVDIALIVKNLDGFQAN